MNTLFVCNSVHYRTRSFDFFVEELLLGEITFDTTSQWRNINLEQFSLVVFWQVLPELDLLTRLKNSNTLLVPMFDDSFKLKFYHWIAYRKFKILCFSKELFEQVSKYCSNVIYAKYFPKMQITKKKERNVPARIFFWEREVAFSLDRLLAYFSESVNATVLYRSDLKSTGMTSYDEWKRFKIQPIDWFNTRQDYHELLAEVDYYVAPRRFEGIGLSFLEAMSLGLPILCLDSSTMNEYVVDGVNGFILKESRKLDLKTLEIPSILRINAGYRDAWETSKERLKVFLGSQPGPNTIRSLRDIRNVLVFHIYLLLKLSR